MTTSEKLRMLRAEMRMTQLQVARAIGVPRDTYIDWECGVTPRYAKDRHKLAVFYDVEVDYLFPDIENEVYVEDESNVLSAKQSNLVIKSKAKQKETYNSRTGETYAEYQRRTNPEYYKSIYIYPKRRKQIEH